MSDTTRNHLKITHIQHLLSLGKTYAEIADAESLRLTKELGVPVNISRSTIAGVVRDLRAGVIQAAPTYIYGWEDPTNEALPVFLGHPHTSGDILILNDLHLPYTDRRLLQAAVTLASQYYGIKQVALVGDTFNGESSSKHPKVLPPVTHDRELADAATIFDYLAGVFEAVYVLPGNHDLWFVKRVDGSMSFSTFVQAAVRSQAALERLIVSDYDRLTVHTGGAVWTIPHQVEYSPNLLVVADRLAQKFQTNIITTHQHHSALGMDRFRRYVIIDSGGLFDASMMSYLQLRTTTRPTPQNGFVLLVDGQGKLRTPGNMTEWEKGYAY